MNQSYGLTIRISDANGESALFLPYDYELDECFQGSELTSKALFFVAQFMANNRYIPAFDNKSMCKAENTV